MTVQFYEVVDSDKSPSSPFLSLQSTNFALLTSNYVVCSPHLTSKIFPKATDTPERIGCLHLLGADMVYFPVDANPRFPPIILFSLFSHSVVRFLCGCTHYFFYRFPNFLLKTYAALNVSSVGARQAVETGDGGR